MKLKNMVNAIEDKKYLGIDLVEIGNAMNISMSRTKLSELSDYF